MPRSGKSTRLVQPAVGPASLNLSFPLRSMRTSLTRKVLLLNVQPWTKSIPFAWELGGNAES